MVRQLKIFPLLLMMKPSVVSSQMPLNEPCTALVKDVFLNASAYPDDVVPIEETSLLCETPSGMLYEVPSATSDWIRENEISGDLFSGQTVLNIPPGTLIDAKTQTLRVNYVPPLINDHNHQTRMLSRMTGTRTVLVIRIEASNQDASYTETTLSNSIFGDGDDKVNLKSQYSACSFGKLEFIPAIDRNGGTTKIRNGVVTIKLKKVSTSAGNAVIVNAVSEEITRQFQMPVSHIADHIMYCLPRGSMNGVGYASSNGWLSVYNDMTCTYVSGQMHEVGHNLGLGHSGRAYNKYGDKVGFMGYSYTQNEAPEMCFNAAKSWELGWYSDKTTSLSLGTNGIYQWNGKLGNIVDYQTSLYSVIIEIEQQSKSNLYLGLNVPKGFNSGSKEGLNKVLITEDDNGMSWRQAELSIGQSYTVESFNGIQEDTLVINVESIDYEMGSADVFILLLSSHTLDPTPSPTRSQDARLPSLIPPPTSIPLPLNCQKNLESCVTSVDCCTGSSCRRVMDGLELAWICRAAATQSKEKLSREESRYNRLNWNRSRRFLRGDTAATIVNHKPMLN